jgi:hypothetical protein
MIPRLRVFVCSSLIALSVSTSIAALAAEPEADSHTRTAARALAAQGSKAFDQQDYATALDLFQRAFSLIEAPTIALMEARTLVQLGRWVEAADRYAAVQKMRSPQPNNQAFTQAVEAATSELALLMPRIPTLKVTVGGTAGESVLVTIDGRRLENVLVGVDNPLDPGAHAIEVRRPNGESQQRDVTLKEGEQSEIEIEFAPPTTPAPVSVQPVVAPEPPAESAGFGGSTLAYSVLGAGAAATAFGAITGIVALNARQDLERECSPGCPSSSREVLDSYRSNRTLSYVGLAVGVVGLGAGAYLLWTSDSDAAPIAVGVSPGGLAMRGAF